MWRRHAPIVLVLGLLVSMPFLQGAMCGDGKTGLLDPSDENEPPNLITFDKQVGCAQDCLSDFRAILDALMHVLNEVDRPVAYLLPVDGSVTVQLDTFPLDFKARLDLRDGPGFDATLNGHIRPSPTDSTACQNGMQTGDVCVFVWEVTDDGAGSPRASGTFSAVHMGWTMGANSHPAHKYTIVDRNVEIVASSDCNMVIHGFDIMMELAYADWSSFYLELFSNYSVGNQTAKLEGWAAWAGSTWDVNQVLTEVSFTVGGESHACKFDLLTFELMSCS